MNVKVPRLSDDWKAWALTEREEVVMNANGSNSVHRIQMIRVIAGDIEYDEETDLGEARHFKHAPLVIQSCGMTKVGKVRDMANRLRNDPNFADEYGLEVPDLPNLYYQYATELYEQSQHRSVFGPDVARSRS